MGDLVSLVLAVAALAAASLHAWWVSQRNVNHAIAGQVVTRLLQKGDLARAIKLSRAAEGIAFFEALRVSLLEAASMRADAPALLAGSYREQPGRRDEEHIEAQLQEAFEGRFVVAERDLANRRAVALVAVLIAAAAVWRQLLAGALSGALPFSVAGLAIVVAAWSAARSLSIPGEARRALAGLLPLLAKCAADGAIAPEASPPALREEGQPSGANAITPVTSWPEEHGLFYAFDDDRCAELQARIAALVNERLPGRRLRVADLSRLGGEAPNRPARLLAVLGDRESVAAYSAEIARLRQEDDDTVVPEVLCASEPPPSKGANPAASFRARRAYFDVRAAVATGEYEALGVEEPLGST